MDRHECVVLEAGAQLQGEVLKQLFIVYGDDDLSVKVLLQGSQKRGKLRDVQVVHGLHRIIKQQPGKFGPR